MADLTVPGGVDGGPKGARRLRPLAGVVLLTLALVGLAPHPASRAATGTVQDSSPIYVGAFTTDGQRCTATLVKPWMAITAKHCGTSNPELKVGVTSISDSDPGKVYAVSKIVQHPDLDLEALYLTWSAPWDDGFVSWGDGSEYDPASGVPIRAWGFGVDRRNVSSELLEMAEFAKTDPCPSGLDSTEGDFCFNTTYSESLCSGDSGGPITQGDKIVAMATTVKTSSSPPLNCENVVAAQAIALPTVAGWLSDRSCEAAPPEQWPCGN